MGEVYFYSRAFHTVLNLGLLSWVNPMLNCFTLVIWKTVSVHFNPGCAGMILSFLVFIDIYT